MKFRCECCDAWHEGPPLSYGMDLPSVVAQLSPEERARRCVFNDELGTLGGEHFFIRGNIVLPVLDGEGPFTWTVWTTLSRANFERAMERWEDPRRIDEPPYFGWLSNALPYEPTTINLKTHVHTRPVGERPHIVLEPTDHPLAVEQREGITRARVQAIAEAVLHPH